MQKYEEMVDGDVFTEAKTWYFAYGSNMKSSIMTGRGIVPFAIKSVVVPTHILTFDIFGIPYREPSFASVAQLATDEDDESKTTSHLAEARPPAVHGVAYLLSREDYCRLVVSEGAGVGYDEIEVNAFVLNEGDDGELSQRENIVVRTLKAKFPWRPNGAPSARYMGLLLDGAVEHRLPPAYIDYLRTLPVYSNPDSWRSRLGGALFLIWWRPMMKGLARSVRVQVNEKGHCPKWLGRVILTVYGLMWGYHDHVHSKIWERGDGTKLKYDSARLI